MNLKHMQSIGRQASRCFRLSAVAANKPSQQRRYCVVLLPLAVVHCTADTKKAQYSTAAGIDMSGGDFKNAASVYEFTVKDTHGNDVSLEKYKGRVLLVVNIASKCGLTKNNYQKLTELKEKFGERGLTILNFPCNQFNSQMPESDGEAMVNVNGDDAAPLYKYLKAKQTGTLGSGLKWNFTKFLVNKEGIPVNRYAPTTDPMDIAKDIEKLL
ncbi:PHGPx [Drosophila busckii]|uniref:Glutathione peroxidase n=1 Tax=Drosophila busckii TaxID=30019 RepID=A0A0M4EGW7_DROBS|nr:PHGPx [Drosophila busckii]